MAPTPLTVEEVHAAYLTCRRRKRNSPSCLNFETDLSANLMRIHRQVTDCAWTPSSHMCFVVTNPKPREIWASPFADRVVHHLAYNRLRPRFEPYWIATSFACIPSRGTVAAADWAERAARKVTAGWTRRAWVLQLDVANFFPSIDRRRMADLLHARTHEPWLHHIIDQVINVDITQGAHFPGDPALLRHVPRSKSLWHAPPGKGLPIGNLTSQFGANAYLDEIDQQAVRRPHARHYGRYVDDMVLLDASRSRLEHARALIENHLERLGLNLHPDKVRLKPLTAGFDFCGRYVLPHRSYLRRATVRRAHTALDELDTNQHPEATVTSYLAVARHADTYRLRAAITARAREHGLSPDDQHTKVTKE